MNEAVKVDAATGAEATKATAKQKSDDSTVMGSDDMENLLG
jgi:hypothetical protein